ncbi:hypothetical protein LSAT2_022708 [Lamellibrachia satsuma]|nr:hypothetical protein LSAT2_022708 [Lamellibrachia satsuma]
MNRVSNKDLWDRTHQAQIEIEILKRRWGWLGHTLGKPSTNITRQVLTWNPQGKRKRGRPKNTWRRDLDVDIKQTGNGWQQLERIAQDRRRWRTVVGGICSRRRLYSWWHLVQASAVTIIIGKLMYDVPYICTTYRTYVRRTVLLEQREDSLSNETEKTAMANSQYQSGFTTDKNSSRVLRPPGGVCSDIFGTKQLESNKSSNMKSNIFGGGDDSAQEQTRIPPQAQNNIYGTAPPATQDGQTEEEEEEKKEEGEEKMVDPPQKTEAAKFKGRGQFNPITGEPYNTQPPANKDLHTSTRVKQPPGGASTSLW